MSDGLCHDLHRTTVLGYLHANSQTEIKSFIKFQKLSTHQFHVLIKIHECSDVCHPCLQFPDKFLAFGDVLRESI